MRRTGCVCPVVPMVGASSIEGLLIASLQETKFALYHYKKQYFYIDLHTDNTISCHRSHIKSHDLGREKYVKASRKNSSVCAPGRLAKTLHMTFLQHTFLIIFFSFSVAVTAVFYQSSSSNACQSDLEHQQAEYWAQSCNAAHRLRNCR